MITVITICAIIFLVAAVVIQLLSLRVARKRIEALENYQKAQDEYTAEIEKVVHAKLEWLKKKYPSIAEDMLEQSPRPYIPRHIALWYDWSYWNSLNK